MPKYAREHAFSLNFALSLKKSQITGLLVLSVGMHLLSLGYSLAVPC